MIHIRVVWYTKNRNRIRYSMFRFRNKNIKRSIMNTCRVLSLSVHSVMSTIFFVSDNGSNRKVALGDFNRIPCACYMLATVLSHTLQLDFLERLLYSLITWQCWNSHVNRIWELAPSVKSIRITGYIKRTSLNNRQIHFRLCLWYFSIVCCFYVLF